MAAGLVAVSAALVGSAAGQTVTLQKPARDFGIFVGDRLTSTAIIDVPPGLVLDGGSVPVAGPVASGIDVSGATIGGSARRVEIRVVYQSFVNPPEVQRAAVPGYKVSFDGAGGARMTVQVPGFGFVASPFRHDLQAVTEPAAIRPDHPADLAGSGGGKAAWWLMASGLVLAAFGAAGSGWSAWRRQASPFGAAAQAVARLAGQQDEASGRAALLAVHRAFDAAAGHRLFADDLNGFLQENPRLIPLRAQIEAFFAASRGVFFGKATAVPAQAWLGFCRDLARVFR